MHKTEMKDDLHVVLGLGKTGFSCVSFLAGLDKNIVVIDSRENPPYLEACRKKYPDIAVLTDFGSPYLDQARTIVVSPGIALQEPAVAKQIAAGKEVIGDIELFARYAKSPIVAITGTNAKSTVTTLVYEILKDAGLVVKVGGNLGTPALELLQGEPPQFYVLELSSFQLDVTRSLQARVATVLNISPDHMDRYDSLQDYISSKLGIYKNADIAVCNADDAFVNDASEYAAQQVKFTLQEPGKNTFGVRETAQGEYLAFGDKNLLPTCDIKLSGKHGVANVLAALAIGHSLGVPMSSMLKTAANFAGLEHRCQFVHEYKGARWYNDSKGTNVGATEAAILGLGSDLDGKIILIAGGVGKDADFATLKSSVAQYVGAAVLMGEAAHDIGDALTGVCDLHFADDFEDAVLCAANIAAPQDVVLLSPACASFDMFDNYEHRGKVFCQLVRSLV